MPRRWLAGVLGCGLGVGAQAAELRDCRAVRPVDAAGERVVGVEDIARDPARERLILSAYDRRAVARALRRGRPAPEGGLYAMPLDRLAAGEVRVERLAPRALPPGGLRPHGLAVAGDRLAVVNRTVAAGRLAPVVDRFALGDDSLEHEARLAESRLCRPNDVAWTAEGRLLVTNDRGACGGPAFWWERVANRPWSFVMAFDDGRGRLAARGFRFANGIAVTPAGAVVAATRGRRLHRLDGASVALPFAPDNLAVDDDGAVWAAGPMSVWRYAAYRAGWSAAPGPSGVARWGDGRRVDSFIAPAAAPRGVTVALPLGDRLLLGAAYDDHLALCARPVSRP
jgi:sugar lactone lactonase YvrE